jgi:hypothetical protein
MNRIVAKKDSVVCSTCKGGGRGSAEEWRLVLFFSDEIIQSGAVCIYVDRYRTKYSGKLRLGPLFSEEFRFALLDQDIPFYHFRLPLALPIILVRILTTFVCSTRDPADLSLLYSPHAHSCSPAIQSTASPLLTEPGQEL